MLSGADSAAKWGALIFAMGVTAVSSGVSLYLSNVGANADRQHMATQYDALRDSIASLRAEFANHSTAVGAIQSAERTRHNEDHRHANAQIREEMLRSQAEYRAEIRERVATATALFTRDFAEITRRLVLIEQQVLRRAGNITPPEPTP